ncbi:MAG: hypothetical protein ACJAVY_000104 [Marinoscillum sp.]|jgi:hypothetical protein
MLTRLLILLVFGMSMLSCASDDQNERKLQAYFDLDSLIQAQSKLLASNNAKLVKQVSDNEKHTEMVDLTPDSASWAKEFAMMRYFNINKPHNVGAYSSESTKTGLSLKAKDNEKQSIKEFILTYQGEELKGITAYSSESKYIYSNTHSLTMSFENGYLENYSLEKTLNMIFIAPSAFRITGSITHD